MVCGFSVAVLYYDPANMSSCVFFCLCFVWFVFACACFLCCFAFGSLCFGSCFCERDKGIGLCIGPQPVDGCSPTAWPLRELID